MKVKQFIITFVFVLLPLASIQAARNQFCKKFQDFAGCVPESPQSTDDYSASGPDYPWQNSVGNVGKTVIVGKADGSLQCKPESGLSLEQMAEELEEINILSSFKKRDSLNRIALKCGNETGMMNVYEIFIEDIEKALEKDFVLLFVSYKKCETKNPQITILDTGMEPVSEVSPPFFVSPKNFGNYGDNCALDPTRCLSEEMD